VLTDSLLLDQCIYLYDSMKQKQYTSLLYLICITVVITIAIQVYWNIRNFNGNKRRLMNEVQISLDNSVEVYFSDLTKNDIVAFTNNFKDTLGTKKVLAHIARDSSFTRFRRKSLRVTDSSSSWVNIIDSGTSKWKPHQIKAMSVFNRLKRVDSTIGLANLTSKIIFAITKDTINFEKLDALLQQELARKDIAIDYSLEHVDRDSTIRTFKKNSIQPLTLSTFSKSTYLPRKERLKLSFSNPTTTILKYSLTGILLSFLLATCIIACLFYLLHTIKKQKQLAEIKNDLISNITHEFKTPIATVATAIEGIKNFNATNDQAKTEKYLNISNQQLQKLHQMVEKLLETATLDNDKLLINKEPIDIVHLLHQLVEKNRMIAVGKELLFSTNVSELQKSVDLFHFENALANLIDNAIKYGGEKIEVNINSLMNGVEISVADNGNSIEPSQGEKIFEKFYRIPTGNRHDIKGFGIGLFYTKKIIEKHGGLLQLIPTKGNTLFKISL